MHLEGAPSKITDYLKLDPSPQLVLGVSWGGLAAVPRFPYPL